MTSRRFFYVAFALLGAALALHASRYWPFLSEETLASLRYASRLASGRGLTFSEGDYVEGYANFLWLVMNALLDAVGVEPIAAARALGFAGVLLAIGCVGLEPRRRGVFLPRLAVGGVLMVATVPVAVAAVAGVEQGLVAGLVALAFRLLERSAFTEGARRPWLSGLPLAGLTLLRADGVFLALALLGGAALLPRPSAASVRRVLREAIPTGVAFVAGLLFRLSYYGDWLPSPARQTVPHRFASGLELVGSGYAAASMLVLLALAATVLSVRRGERFRLAMPWAVVLVTTLTAVAGGPEPAPGHRALVPALVALCFLAADEVGDEWSRISGERVLALPILALCAFLHFTQSSETDDARRVKTERSASEGIAVGRTLGRAFATKRPLVAADTPGALAYSSDLEVLDLGGVHGEAPASAADVLARSPDLAVFGDGPGRATPTSEAGLELFRNRRFLENYQLISVESIPRNTAIGELWIRRERGRLGITRKDDRIEVPGYLFTGQASRASAAIERSSALVAELDPGAPGVLPELELPAGRYRLEVIPSDGPPVVDVRCRDVSMPRSALLNEVVVQSDGRTPISIVIAPGGTARSMKLRRVALTRVSNDLEALRCAPRGRPLTVPAALVAQPKSSKNLWNHPAHVSFARDGLIIAAGELPSVGGVELSLSHNDAYVVELRRGGLPVWTATVEAKRGAKRPGLLSHRLELPKRLDESGNYEVFIKPRRGDEPLSLGHARLF
ncbi:MAG TPA: hypothetical protein VFZ53_04045 [Polyangiaceae bacterium]